MKYPQQVSMPSAVSSWLEEQLEARGIDGVVYTRYVLSLLRTHNVDVIYPEDDLPFSSLKKQDSKRSGGSRKRFRGSSEWWRHAHLDAEQLKRSAAVECLMSASDQNCEIESLVDELCEKLKEVSGEHQSPIKPETESAGLTEPVKPRKRATPREQAEKYYAAFPALGPQSSSPKKLVAIIPKWIQSPKKKAGRKGNARQNIGTKLYQQNKLDPAASSMKSKSSGSGGMGGKQRHSSYFGRNKKEFVCRGGAAASPEVAAALRRNVADSAKEPKPVADQCLDGGAAAWHDEEMNMYDDLPVNIRELLESPVPPEFHDDPVDFVHYGNVQDKLKDGMKQNFISCNITSSIWSDKQTMEDVAFDNSYNSSRDINKSKSTDIDRRFGAITIDAERRLGVSIWSDCEPPASLQNEANARFEQTASDAGVTFGGFRSLSTPWTSDVEFEEECFENEHLLNRVAVSLMKINHNKDKSCFAEIVPTNDKSNFTRPSYDPFGFTPGSYAGHFSGSFEKECDLLTSEKSHFRPISDESNPVKAENMYVDGSTFIISNNLDKVNYMRSESGSMYLETEHGNSKKYCEYYLEDGAHCDEKAHDFVLKFSICQNDKACQTDDEFASCAASGPESIDSALYMEEQFEREVSPKNCPISTPEDDLKLCTCPQLEPSPATNKDHSGNGACAVHPFNNNNNNDGRPESMMSEIMWRYESRGCEACSSNNNILAWNTDWPRNAQTKVSDWGSQSMRNIWSGGEVCQACLSQASGEGGRPPQAAPPDSQRSQLREDISNDGEQLLSDLSSVQKCYRDDLPDANEFACCDIATFLVPKERKRRHSYISDHVPDPHANSRSSWSFASRLEEDCLIQMSTMPSLRSVTL